jgi:hypothetical protein
MELPSSIIVYRYFGSKFAKSFKRSRPTGHCLTGIVLQVFRNCFVTVSLASKRPLQLESASVKPFSRLVGLAFLASINLSITSAVLGQSALPSPGAGLAFDATATISFGGSQSVTATSNGAVFDRVGLQPNQVVDVTVQFPPEKSGHTIIVEPLDGGCLIGPTNKLVVAADGTFSFRFQAGRDSGDYQVSFHDGAQEIGLQFWVLDLQNPQNNPSVLTPQ